MGEAKQKNQQLRDTMFRYLDLWSFPPSEAEAQAVREIENLPKVTVTRLPAETLAFMRMKANECHANAQFMQDNDPEGQCRRVSGYWPQQGNFVLHSVIEREGEYFCVTPTSVGSPEQFIFIPDPDVNLREEGDYRITRKGMEVKVGFRKDPEETIRVSEVMRTRLRMGLSVLKAGEPPF